MYAAEPAQRNDPGELQVVVHPPETPGGRVDLVDGGAFVGADDLPLVEEDDGQRNVFHHCGQVRRQPIGATPFHALPLVDDERAALLRREPIPGNSSRAALWPRTASRR